MIYTAINMKLPSHEDTYIPLSCEQLEEERAKHGAAITANVRGVQLVVFLTDPTTLEPVGKALGWPGDSDTDDGESVPSVQAPTTEMVPPDYDIR